MLLSVVFVHTSVLTLFSTKIMFKQIGLLFLIVVATNAANLYKSFTLTSGDEMKLRPSEDIPSESRWDLQACEGCKIVSQCVILTPSCRDHLLTIFDGVNTTTHCNPESRLIPINSQDNKMSITIKRMGPGSGSYCSISVTKPYLKMKYEKINSAEHGNGVGATRSTSCKCGWSNKRGARIVSGSETSVNEYPFIVALKIKVMRIPYCGGSIITPYHVLTAAHCTFPYRRVTLTVIVGEHNLNIASETPHTKVIEVEKSIHHNKYTGEVNLYDISILLLKEKIEFNEAVGPVCLPSFRQKNFVGEYLKVMGWGNIKTNGTYAEKLLQTYLKVIDLDICETVYKSIKTFDPSQICTWAPNTDSCQGDSGGPLVWRDPDTNRYVQAALVSYGQDCAATEPSVNTDIAYYMDWIRKTIQETSPQEVCV